MFSVRSSGWQSSSCSFVVQVHNALANFLRGPPECHSASTGHQLQLEDWMRRLTESFFFFPLNAGVPFLKITGTVPLRGSPNWLLLFLLLFGRFSPSQAPSLKTSHVRKFVDCILMGGADKTRSLRTSIALNSVWLSNFLLPATRNQNRRFSSTLVVPNVHQQKLPCHCGRPFNRSASFGVMTPDSRNLFNSFLSSSILLSVWPRSTTPFWPKGFKSNCTPKVFTLASQSTAFFPFRANWIPKKLSKLSVCYGCTVWRQRFCKKGEVIGKTFPTQT